MRQSAAQSIDFTRPGTVSESPRHPSPLLTSRRKTQHFPLKETVMGTVILAAAMLVHVMFSVHLFVFLGGFPVATKQ